MDVVEMMWEKYIGLFECQVQYCYDSIVFALHKQLVLACNLSRITPEKLPHERIWDRHTCRAEPLLYGTISSTRRGSFASHIPRRLTTPKDALFLFLLCRQVSVIITASAPACSIPNTALQNLDPQHNFHP
jgi:hypothetical protein